MRARHTLTIGAILVLLGIPSIVRAALFTAPGWSSRTAFDPVYTSETRPRPVPNMAIRTNVRSGGVVVTFCATVLVPNTPAHSIDPQRRNITKLFVGAKVDGKWLEPGGSLTYLFSEGQYEHQDSVGFTSGSHCAQWAGHVDGGTHRFRVYWEKAGGTDGEQVQMFQRVLTVIGTPE